MEEVESVGMCCRRVSLNFYLLCPAYGSAGKDSVDSSKQLANQLVVELLKAQSSYLACVRWCEAGKSSLCCVLWWRGT